MTACCWGSKICGRIQPRRDAVRLIEWLSANLLIYKAVDGLQIRLVRFDSGPRLQIYLVKMPCQPRLVGHFCLTIDTRA